MEQYIKKSALVAWAKETYLCENASMIRKVCYKQLLNFLDTLEVKEVQEYPISDFEMALTEMIDKAQKCVVEPWAIAAQWKDYLIELAKSEEPVSDDLEEAAIRYATEGDEISGLHNQGDR